jgi:hypothetical protein
MNLFVCISVRVVYTFSTLFRVVAYNIRISVLKLLRFKSLEWRSLLFHISRFFLNRLSIVLTGAFFFAFTTLGISQRDQKMELHESLKVLELTAREDAFVHFELFSPDNKIYDAMNEALNNFMRIESYRMIDERRKIFFNDGLSYVVLFSAAELRESSGRSIRPQNIRSGDKCLQVIFHLTPQGTIKEEVIDK